MSVKRLDDTGLSTVLTKLKSEIMYVSGDTISLTGFVECAGRTAASGKTLAFQIPIAKPIEPGRTLTINTATKLSIYHNTGGTTSSTIATWAPTSTTITYSNFGIRVVMARSTTWFSASSISVTVALENLSLSVT